MMKNTRIAIVVLLITLISCKDEELDLTKDPLDGTLAGDPWVYGVGGVAQDNSTSALEAIMLDQENLDPCAVVTTVRPHITMRFPPRRGNYTLSVDNVQVVFNLDGGKKLTATAGFLEVVEINGFEIIGFLSADFDEDNNVQGSFLLQVCN